MRRQDINKSDSNSGVARMANSASALYLIWNPLSSAANRSAYMAALQATINIRSCDGIPESLLRKSILGDGRKMLMGFLNQPKVFRFGCSLFQVVKEKRVVRTKQFFQ